MDVLLMAVPIMDVVDGDVRPAEMDAVRVCPPYGLYLLSSVLEAAGHEVRIADLVAAGTQRLDAWHADLDACELVGIGATSLCWPTVVDVVRQIRARRPDVPIVVGNVHATLFDEYVLSRFPIDFAIRGEAEHAIVKLVDALEGRGAIGQVPNLSYRTTEGRFVRNPEGPKLGTDEIVRAPLPDYAKLPEGRYKGLAIESSRGCALDCSFCSTPYRRTWRGLDPELFVDRLEGVMEHASLTRFGTLHVIDDEFAMNPARASEIAKVLKRRGLSPRLIYDARSIDFLKGDFADTIAEFTHQFLIGAECGYDEGLRLVGKGTTTATLTQAAKKLHELGIAEKADFSFILGLPWEGMEEVMKTIRFAAQLHGAYGVRLRFNWYIQVPGSRLWDEARRAETVTEAMYDEYGCYRDLYLFRSGLRLTPSEMWKVRDVVTKLQWLSDQRFDHPMIDFFFPAAIERYYPRELLSSESRDGSGLVNLRRLAKAR